MRAKHIYTPRSKENKEAACSGQKQKLPIEEFRQAEWGDTAGLVDPPFILVLALWLSGVFLIRGGAVTGGRSRSGLDCTRWHQLPWSCLFISWSHYACIQRDVFPSVLHTSQASHIKGRTGSSATCLCFYWNIIALQCCVSSYCTMMWISYMYTYTSSFLNFPPTPPPSQPSDHHRASNWAPCARQQLPASDLFYAWECIHISSALSTHPRLSFPHCVHKSILHACFFTPGLHFYLHLFHSFHGRFPCSDATRFLF